VEIAKTMSPRRSKQKEPDSPPGLVERQGSASRPARKRTKSALLPTGDVAADFLKSWGITLEQEVRILGADDTSLCPGRKDGILCLDVHRRPRCCGRN
jgi:hypothetical protein